MRHILVTLKLCATSVVPWYGRRSLVFLVTVHQFFNNSLCLWRINTNDQRYITRFLGCGPSLDSAKSRMKSTLLMKSARHRRISVSAGVVPSNFSFQSDSHIALSWGFHYRTRLCFVPRNQFCVSYIQRLFIVSLTRSNQFGALDGVSWYCWTRIS